MKKPELFLEREDRDKRFHISLHESGHWHMKVDHKVVARWERPDEMVPGYTHAFGIVQPAVVAIRGDAAPDRVQLVHVRPSAQPTYFDAYIERPGASMDGWPGKNADGTVLVGRIPLAADAGTCCVVAHQRALPPAKATFPGRPTEEELTWMQEAAAKGTLISTVYGVLTDGAIALIDLRAAADVLSTQEATSRRRHPRKIMTAAWWRLPLRLRRSGGTHASPPKRIKALVSRRRSRLRSHL